MHTRKYHFLKTSHSLHSKARRESLKLCSHLPCLEWEWDVTQLINEAFNWNFIRLFNLWSIFKRREEQRQVEMYSNLSLSLFLLLSLPLIPLKPFPPFVLFCNMWSVWFYGEKSRERMFFNYDYVCVYFVLWRRLFLCSLQKIPFSAHECRLLFFWLLIPPSLPHTYTNTRNPSFMFS